MVKIIWTSLAVSDLKIVHDYISAESKVYADRMVEKIIARVSILNNFPESGRVVPEFGQKSIRELLEGNYRIVYRIHPNHIGIARIHHTARLLRKL
ncbi:MAG: type II toxin-antitoxin system RelE/ParE family toxin [Verrucomicrobia bacterium]|nr:type II toxin-antitoxin system RelE/ParE family toxin [Prolixibacteraceae bacterium]